MRSKLSHSVMTAYLFLSFSTAKGNECATIEEGATGVTDTIYEISSGPRKTVVSLEKATLLETVKSEKAMFQSDRFWELARKFYRNEQIADVLKRWYEHDPVLVERLQAEASRLGEDLGVLLMDPGIVQNLERFLKFQSENSHIRHPFQLRSEFSRALGERTIYRGVTLTPTQYEQVLEIGLVGNLWRNLNQVPMNSHLLHFLFNQDIYSSPAASSPYSDMKARLRGDIRSSLYNSASHYIEPTHVGAWLPTGNGKTHRPKGDFYLFEITLPRLDVIEGVGTFSNLKQTGSTYHIEGKEKTISVEDPGFEIFFQNALPGTFKTFKYETYPEKWYFTRP